MVSKEKLKELSKLYYGKMRKVGELIRLAEGNDLVDDRIKYVCSKSFLTGDDRYRKDNNLFYNDCNLHHVDLVLLDDTEIEELKKFLYAIKAHRESLLNTINESEL